MDKPKTLEEGVAALATVLSDNELAKAADGKYGEMVRLLTVGEQVRRKARRSKDVA